jgi:eukaryotic-like serine/threonine-protein kinase
VAAVGNYELIDRYAVGGVAEIYRARDVRSGEVVVIKRMRPDVPLTPDNIAAFAREMHVAFRAKHKNLIRCFNLGSHQGLDYGVLEYVDGQDLENLLVRCRKQNIRLPRGFATFIACEILEGLDYAHGMVDERGEPMRLVHRDVAPKNIFVRYDGQVRVADFGLGLASAYERLEDEAVVGTPGYFAPEQVLRTQVDGRTDVYAVGLILHEMLSGQRAIDVAGLRDADLLKAHRRPSIRELGQDVPEGLRTVVEVALDKDPDNRYHNARDFRQAIARSEVPPDMDAPLGIATMLRQLFDAEFKATRLTGSPLTYMSK